MYVVCDVLLFGCCCAFGIHAVACNSYNGRIIELQITLFFFEKSNKTLTNSFSQKGAHHGAGPLCDAEFFRCMSPSVSAINDIQQFHMFATQEMVFTEECRHVH